MNNKIFGCSIVDKSVSKTLHVNHVFRHVTGYKNNDTGTEPIEMNVEIIILSGGGLVLPYFKNSRGKWNIVLVTQFRPAVRKITLEAAGGRLDREPAKIALARELLEETGIKVKSQSIKIVVNEYTHPSILSSCNIGGIVKINQRMVKNKRKAGKECEDEWTQVEVLDLIGLMKKRDLNLITLDLMTSRLLDEVAKATGLLIKKY